MITPTADGRYRVECAENPCLRPLLGRMVDSLSHAQNIAAKHRRELHPDLPEADDVRGPSQSERDEMIYIIARASEDWDEGEIADALIAAGYCRKPF